jgi:thioredoxin-like negative regulator of GroEL
MSVKKISKQALDKIMAGKVREPATCVIKFYSNTCDLCHNLQEYYEAIAERDEFTDIHFFAFNIDEHPAIEKALGFNGVPTLSLMKVGIPKKRIRILEDPEDPHKLTWYRSSEIIDFIERER